MKFEKRLVILGGENNAKGTLTLETNAYGTFATFNVYNIPDLLSGEYAVGIKNSEQVFTRKIGSMGRILSRFKINDMSLRGIHCVIYDTATETPVLYGHTPDAPKLWAGNMMDGIRSRKVEFRKTTADKAEIEKTLPSYSDRPQEIENYFLDILPQDGSYRDSAVAQVNYYPSDMSIEVSYTNREQSGYKEEENPVDAFIKSDVEKAQSGGDAESGKMQPWEYAKQYIDRYKNYAAASGVHKNIGAESAENAKVDKTEAFIGKSAPEMIDNGEKDAKVDKTDTLFSENDVKTLDNGKKRGASVLETPDEAAATVVPPVSEFTAENALREIKTETIFYEQIKGQLNELFGSNPQFDTLNSLMPDTKWIKVDYDGAGKYYVVGIIGEKPDYICYGVPASFTPEPPDELDGYCQWLPLDPEKPEGDGFWLMYQDAVTGKSVSL